MNVVLVAQISHALTKLKQTHVFENYMYSLQLYGFADNSIEKYHKYIQCWWVV
jgi:hypothetical protein